MKISRVRCYLLSCALAEPLRLPYPGGRRIIRKRDALVIHVQAENGFSGYAPGAAGEIERDAILGRISPFLEGRELADPDALRVHFQERFGYDAHLMRLYSSVEIALFDLLGKVRDAPASEFLGGRVRDRIRIYASAGFHAAPEHFAEEAYCLSAMGFRAYKMRAGMSARRDGQAAELVRRSAGAGFDLMVDAGAWWKTGGAVYSQQVVDELIAEFGAMGVTWVDQPLPPGDHEAYRALRERDLAPIAAGQEEPDDFGLLDLLFNEGVDYLQMNIVTQSGYWAARRILPEVAHAGVRFAFHGCSNPLEVAVAAQLGVCWPEMVAEWLEYPWYSSRGNPAKQDFPLGEEMLEQPLDIVEGSLIAPRGAGLGIRLNEKIFDRYPWIPGPAAYFEREESGERAS